MLASVCILFVDHPHLIVLLIQLSFLLLHQHFPVDFISVKLGSESSRIGLCHNLGFLGPLSSRCLKHDVVEPILLIKSQSLGRSFLHRISLRTVDHFELMLHQYTCLSGNSIRLCPRRAHSFVSFPALIIVITFYSIDHVLDYKRNFSVN